MFFRRNFNDIEFGYSAFFRSLTLLRFSNLLFESAGTHHIAMLSLCLLPRYFLINS